MLNFAVTGVELAVVVDVALEQIRAYRAVLYRQGAAVEGLVVILYVLVQCVALHAAYRHDVRIRVVLADVVHFEQVVKRFAGGVQIIVAEVPAPLCHHHSAASVARLLTERKHGRVAVVAHIFADVRRRLIVEILIARHHDVLGLVLVPLRLYPLQSAVGIEKPLGHGEVHRVELVLIPRAFRGSLGAVKGVPDVERHAFEILHGACERTLCRSVRTVPLRVTREFESAVDGIFRCVSRAVGQKLDTRHVVSALVAVDALGESRAVYLPVHHLEFVEQVFVVALVRLVQKLQVELHIIVRVAVSVVRHRHLDFVAPAVRREVEPLRIVDIDVKPVVAPHIRLIRIAILDEVDDLHRAVLVVGIVLDVKPFPALRGGGEVVHNVGGVVVQSAAVRKRDFRRRRNDDAERDDEHDNKQHRFVSRRFRQNTITSLSSVISHTSS